MICNYSVLAHNLFGNAKFVLEDIDPMLCTHIVYSFLKLERNQLTFSDLDFETQPPDGLGNVANFTGLKNVNPALRVFGAVGGSNTESKDFSDMAKSDDARALFVGSVVEFLYYNGFDGFMLTWSMNSIMILNKN